MTRKLTLFLICAFEITSIVFVAVWGVRAEIGYCNANDQNWTTNCQEGDTLSYVSHQFGMAESVIHKYCNFDKQIVISKYNPAKELEVSNITCVFQKKVGRTN